MFSRIRDVFLRYSLTSISFVFVAILVLSPKSCGSRMWDDHACECEVVAALACVELVLAGAERAGALHHVVVHEYWRLDQRSRACREAGGQSDQAGSFSASAPCSCQQEASGEKGAPRFGVQRLWSQRLQPDEGPRHAPPATAREHTAAGGEARQRAFQFGAHPNQGAACEHPRQ